MQAIITKYNPATNSKPSKMSAKCVRGSLVVSYDHGLDADGNHVAACNALCARFAAEDEKQYGTRPAVNPCSRAKANGVIPDGRQAFCFIPVKASLL